MTATASHRHFGMTTEGIFDCFRGVVPGGISGHCRVLARHYVDGDGCSRWGVRRRPLNWSVCDWLDDRIQMYRHAHFRFARYAIELARQTWMGRRIECIRYKTVATLIRCVDLPPVVFTEKPPAPTDDTDEGEAVMITAGSRDEDAEETLGVLSGGGKTTLYAPLD